MLSDVLQDKAAQYVSGGMTAEERDAFEVLLEFQDELRGTVEDLRDAVAKVAVAEAEAALPPATLKARILGALPASVATAEALVATDAEGRIVWVNEDFSALCGYSIEELRGRKPGTLLQGPDTDAAAVQRIRSAVHERRACCETIVNYHKDGTRYRADVRIAPILDDQGAALWFVARERKVD